MTQKVLVVGGAGYIGGSLTDILLEKKIPFTVYDNLTYEHQYLKPVDFIYGDIRDTTKLKKILPSYSHVIWLAALVGDGACAIKPALTHEINQDSVEWLSRHYRGRIVFTSTCSVYGLNKYPVSEDAPTNPLSVYAQTKLAAEQFLAGRNALILRLGTAYGLGDTYSRIRMDLAVNYMTMNAIQKGFLTVFGGQQWRPFIHVKDIGRVIVHNLFRDITGVYNCTRHNKPIIKVAEAIQKQTQCTIHTTEMKYEDDRNYRAITTKGKHAGLYPVEKMSISDGIREIKQLVLSQRIKNLELEYYSNERHLLQHISHYEEFTPNTV